MPKDHDRIKVALEAGEALFSARNYEKAAAEYEKALRLLRAVSSEGDACFRAHVKYGACLVFSKASDEARYKEAICLFTEALKLKSEDADGRRNDEADAYRYWGDALYKLKQYEQAAAKYAEATGRRPSYPEAYKGWGNALYFAGQAAQALKKYKEAVHHRRDYSEAIFNWGVVLQNSGDYEGAAVKYERVVELGMEEAAAAYNNWGHILGGRGDYESAAQKFSAATRLASPDDEAHIMYNNWGDALFHLRRYDEAVGRFKESQQRNPEYQYAFHNEAFVYWQEGRYRDARRVAAKACELYRRAQKKRQADRDGLFFRSYAELLHKIVALPEEAEQAYLTALEINPEDVEAATGLVFLYAEMREDMIDLDKKAAAYWKSAELTQSTRKRLEDRLKQKEKDAAGHGPGENGNRRVEREVACALHNLGRLLLAAKEYEEAESHLLKAAAADSSRAEPYADLGVLYARQEDCRRSVKCFESALERDPDNLSVRSNLAETYRKLGEIDRAEQEYKRILGITACHVESYIGLGEVYVEMGDDGDADRYEEAVSNFDKGLAVSKLECASKRLKEKEAAAVYYARGYARVSLYESLKLNRDEDHLRKACDDFAAAYACDGCLHKAKRAKEKVELRLKTPAGQLFTKTLGPALIFALAFVVFMLTQGSFFLDRPRLDPDRAISATGYALASFGALMFMLASLSLPQLLRFKVAGVELEKSSIDQVAIPEYFRLSKPE